ncbi:uncharacterized protein [Diadema antillarum]|uniref:uncharacterized protein n=1 Tax=Diadema antillarum TaxID=105358 RepID=UPI003A891A66
MAARWITVLGLLLVLMLGLGAALTTSPEPLPEGGPSSEPTYEPASSVEPSPEVEAEPEPEPEPSVEPEPEPEGETTPGPPDSPFAEPVPRWDIALPKFGWAWPFHIYLMGVLFAILAIYSLLSIIRLRQRRLLSYGYFIALNLLMLLMGTIRAVYLLVDAYNYKGKWHNVLAYLLLGTGFPCLTSAFSILFMALLQSTKTQVVPPTIQKPKYLAIVIVIHFIFAFIADVVVGLYVTASVLLLICQCTFVIWGLFLTISYLVIFRRLYRSTVRKYREIKRLSIRTGSVMMPGQRGRPIITVPRNNWGSAIKVTMVTALLGLAVALLQLYGMLVVYGPVGGQKQIPDPWPWWSYQFVFRLLEFLMCALMSFVATQPFRYTRDGREKRCTCLPCWSALLDACGCRKTDDYKQEEEELNSQVWSSAFEPCLPDKPVLYQGLAASTLESDLSSRNTNGNNTSVNINVELTEQKVQDKDLRLELSENDVRRTKSSEPLGSEMNNRMPSPHTAPVGGVSSRPFPDAPPSQGNMVRNEFQASVKRGDKVTNCLSDPLPSSGDGEIGEGGALDDASGHHPKMDKIENANTSDVLIEVQGSNSGIEVTEKTPLDSFV